MPNQNIDENNSLNIEKPSGSIILSQNVSNRLFLIQNEEELNNSPNQSILSRKVFEDDNKMILS